MKALIKLFADFLGWRWAPTVGLFAASVLYVLFVVVLVPEEIGVPVANPRFSTKSRADGATTTGLPEFPSTSNDAPTETVSQPMRPTSLMDFGRRGFSPPLPRADPPPEPVPPPPEIVPPPVFTPPPEPAPVAAVAPAEAVVAPAPPTAGPGFFRSLSGAFRGMLPGNQNQQPPSQQPPSQQPPSQQPPSQQPPSQPQQPDDSARVIPAPSAAPPDPAAPGAAPAPSESPAPQ